MKEKLTKEWVGLLCILEMTLPIKFETICVFLSITIRLLTEIEKSKKSLRKIIRKIIAIICRKFQQILRWKTNFPLIQEILT